MTDSPRHLPAAAAGAAQVAALLEAGQADAAEALARRLTAEHPDAAIAVRAWRFALLAAHGRRVEPRMVATDVRSLAAETYGIGYTLHAIGRIREGWRYMEARRAGGFPTWSNPFYERMLASGARPWHGERVEPGTTLCISHEQGLGDTFQFIRYLPWLKAAGYRVLLFARTEMLGLLRAQPLLSDVFLFGPDAREIPRPDWCLPLLSVPILLGDAAPEVPGGVPYLVAPAGPPQSFGAPGMRRIGIAWRGAAYGLLDRDVPVELVTQAVCGRGAQVVSLKVDATEAERQHLAQAGVHGLDELDPPGLAFVGTAALLAELDLVIASDTSVAHLAGAMGRPVWVMLKEEPDWRWQFRRSDSDWYPTMRLFRQPRTGDWDSVLADIAEALAGYLSGPPGR